MSVAVVALFGAVALGLIMVGVYLWLLVSAVDTRSFVAAVKKLMLAGKRDRAVTLCRVIGSQNADRQLILFLLGLELPRQTLPEGAAVGYRGALAVERFEDRIAQLIAAQAPRFYRQTNRRGVAAVVGGAAGAVLAVVAHGLGERFGPALVALGVDDAPEHALLYGAGAVLGLTILAGKRWRRTMAGRIEVLREIVPLVRPLEEMLPGDLTAAAAARALLDDVAEADAERPTGRQDARSMVGAPLEPTSRTPEDPARRPCPSCGRMNAQHWRFCLGCGRPLE